MVAKVDAFHPKWNFEYHLLGLQRLQTINPPKCYLLHPSGARCFASKTGQDHLRTKCSRVTCGTCHSEKRLEISSEGVTLDKMDGNNWNNLRTKKHVDLRNGTTKANRPDPEKKNSQRSSNSNGQRDIRRFLVFTTQADRWLWMEPVLQEKWRDNFNGDLWLLVVFQHDAIELLDMEKANWECKTSNWMT